MAYGDFHNVFMFGVQTFSCENKTDRLQWSESISPTLDGMFQIALVTKVQTFLQTDWIVGPRVFLNETKHINSDN